MRMVEEGIQLDLPSVLLVNSSVSADLFPLFYVKKTNKHLTLKYASIK